MAALPKLLIARFSGAVKKVLKFLGIGSPSKVFEDIGRNLIAGLAKGIAGRMKEIPNLLGRLWDMAGGVLFGGPSVGRGSYGGNRAIVKRLAEALYGWTGGQWIALANLISGESGFNNLAQNPTSSAYGMFQFLDSTWASVGAKKTADPYAQAVAGLRYIASRYGSPAAAYGAWLGRSPHWYGEGGIFRRPTIIGVGERGPEAVLPLNGAGGVVELGPKTIKALAEEIGLDDRTLRTMARHTAAAVAANPPRIYLDRQEVSRAVATGDLWNARR
jgi:SLT domain-containing protein